MTYPADPISAVQDAIIARLEVAFAHDASPRLLTEIKPLHMSLKGGGELIDQIRPPSLNILFMEARPTAQLDTVDLHWAVYAASKRSTLDARTRGDAREPGAYLIASRAMRALNEFVPGIVGASALSLNGCQNVASQKLVREKLSVVALTFTGQATIGFNDPAADLAPFLHYRSDWDVPPHRTSDVADLPVDNPDATNDVFLEGASDDAS